MKKNCASDRNKYDSRVLYQNLYCNYIAVLEGNLSYGKLVANFVMDQNKVYFNEYENITFYVTRIWAYFIKNSKYF